MSTLIFFVFIIKMKSMEIKKENRNLLM